MGTNQANCYVFYIFYIRINIRKECLFLDHFIHLTSKKTLNGFCIRYAKKCFFLLLVPPAILHSRPQAEFFIRTDQCQK